MAYKTNEVSSFVAVIENQLFLTVAIKCSSLNIKTF